MTPERAARIATQYEGVPAEQAARAAGVTLFEMRAARVRLDRDPEQGERVARRQARRIAHPLDRLTFGEIDALMRCNRSVCG